MFLLCTLILMLNKPSSLYQVPNVPKTDIVESLDKLQFLNSGTVRSTDRFGWRKIPIQYLEKQNVSTVSNHAWADYGSANYLYQITNSGAAAHPPSGMRSSVQLGGVSTGAIEMRADGSFHEWTIMNQTPAGAAKIQVFDDVLFGIRTSTRDGITNSKMLKTHARAPFPSIDSITYSGQYPVSRFEFKDSKIPLNTLLYAYSGYEVNNLNESANPAISFTFKLSNPSKEPLDVALMFNLPFGIEPMTQRVHNTNGVYAAPLSIHQFTPEAHTDIDTLCYTKCLENILCKSWTLFRNTSKCVLYATVNLNTYSQDCSSGVKGIWETNGQTSPNLSCLTLNRDGMFAPNGNISTCVSKSTPSNKVSYTTSNSLAETWSDFTKNGYFQNSFTSNVQNSTAPTAAVSINQTLAGGETTTVNFILAWNFPNRDFSSKVYGNYYSHIYPNSLSSAEHMANNSGRILKNIQDLHGAFIDSSLPSYLSDMLINSISHVRTVMWFADGRWRQWEANDCTNIDSVHNDGERHIPYIMFLPDSTRNKIEAWAASQQSNGMIPEQLRNGCSKFSTSPKIDIPGGRRMSDVSSMFIVYILELYLWANDTVVLDKYWPNVKRAAEWHMSQAEEYGTLTYIVNTYDILAFNLYKFASYNSAFHILALKAASRLAKAKGDDKFATLCDQYSNRGEVSMNKFLWNETAGYFNAYNNETGPNPGAIMTDTFYAQVLAFSLNLGSLVNQTKLLSHMKAEYRKNTTPYGMLVVTGRYPYPGPSQDNAIWQMGNPNWATINIHLNQSVKDALTVAKVTLDRWRSVVNDQWNVAGVSGGLGYGAEGLPYITSHYGYFMSSWHLVMAISGQTADLPNGILKFTPRLDCPYRLPVILPGILAELHCKKEKTILQKKNGLSKRILTRKHILMLKLGFLSLETLSVHDSSYPNSTIILKKEQKAEWVDI